MSKSEISLVLDYWLDECQEEPARCKSMSGLWYGGSPEVDKEISEKFSEVYERACSDSLSSWAETAEGALALVIVLDQFSRQIHRKTTLAFAQDPMARAIARRSVSTKLDHELSVPGRLFLYHPFQHSEYLEDQELGVQLAQSLLEECSPDWREYVEESLKYFIDHRDIIRRFGRFPHRNRVLNRESTQEELKFLESTSSYGQ
ncbi:MAG: DUF924 domain-containing protein [Gammaproteobacteria bacterium]|nr:DUF924 domain-containing protein [Gammaproteobacteria bacterium]